MDIQRLTDLFHENFTARGELGASVSVWRDGVEVVSLAHGWCDREATRSWTAATPVLFWSATKGLTAACVLHAAQEWDVALDEPVARHWPEFSQSGKSAITIAELLSHRAGLSALTTPPAVTDYEAVVRALAAEPPHWLPGEGHGYHPRTWGFLCDELLRRITGQSVGQYWRQHFAEPLGLEAWIGLPPERLEEVAPVYSSRGAPPKDDVFYRQLLTSGSFTSRTFASPRGLHSAAALNTAEARTASYPAFGGIGTARALGKFYAMLASGGIHAGRRFFSPETIAQMTSILTQGEDRVLQMPTAFSAGFMLDPLDAAGCKLRRTYGPSPRAFGHPGAGGSLGFASPDHGVAFAYVMNQMEPGVLPNAKSLRLVEALAL